MDEPVILIGSRGHAKSVLMALQSCGRRCLGIFTNLEADIGIDIGGVSVSGSLSDVPPEGALHVCVGDYKMKQNLMSRFPGRRWATIVSAAASVHPSSQLGVGTFVGSMAVIEPGVRVGAHSIISAGCVLHHDSHIGRFTLLGGNCTVAGNASCGSFSLMGALSGIAPRVRVGDSATVAAGTVARFHVPNRAHLIAAPALLSELRND